MITTLLSPLWHGLKLGWLLLVNIPHFWKFNRAQRHIERFKAERERERLDRLRNPWRYGIEVEDN